MSFIYKVSKMNLGRFRKEDHVDARETGRYVLALKETIEKFPEAGNDLEFPEFWTSPLPTIDKDVVVWRSGPFSEGYVVSPVELPWMEAESEKVTAARA